jgi:hypothetical protein
MPAEINDKISIFVKDQFPQFYKEDGPIFEAFVEAYYEYLEQTGQTLDFSRNLIEYQDIDTTTAEFLDQFKKLYLEQLPGLIKSDDRLTIKHIMDFYRAKGSERSIQLLFRILFDEAAVVNKPGEDVLKPSTSEFRLPRYIEVYAPEINNLIALEGLEIVGATSGAKGFIETISTNIIGGARVHIIQLSNLRGNFLRGEIIAKSSDGITDNMPVVTGSLSSVDITLGGQDFVKGDEFNVIADVGKQGLVRATAIDNATGLIEYQLSNGGFGFSTNTDFTSIDVNEQHLVVNNVVNAAQAYSNSSQIDNAEFIRFERVDQKVEKLSFLSGSDLISHLNTEIAAERDIYIVGKEAGGNVVANGFLIAETGSGANGTVTIAPHTGTFGDQLALSANLVVNTHIFQQNEIIDEEDNVTLNITSTSGSFSAGDDVKGDNSLAVGKVVTVNSTVMTLNSVFGTFTTDDNVQDITSGVANTANVTGTTITAAGANAMLGTFSNSNAKVYSLNISDIKGAFDNGKKIRGRRSLALATLTSQSDTGASDIFANGVSTINATVDTFTNVSVHAEVIGSNSTNVGFRNPLYSNGSTGTFYQNTAAFIIGVESNTYANVVTVGTGNGSTFKIGGLENEESITIYTDFVGDNNTANVAFLDCVIDGQSSNSAGGNSGIGFVDTIVVRTAGSGYANSEVVTFSTGGAGGGAPTTNATGTLLTNGSGAIQSVTVTAAGAGFFTQNVVGTITTSSGSSGVLTANVDFGYGFPKNPQLGFEAVLNDVFTRFSGNIGTITSLTDINPGNNYNFDPFVSVYTKGIAKFDRKDVVVNLTGMNTGAGGDPIDFVIGETVNQTVTSAGQTLTVNTITVQNTSSSSNTTTGNTLNFPVGSSIVQVKNSTVNAIGDIFFSNSTVLGIKNGRTKQTFANGLVTFTINTQPFTSDSINAISIASANSLNSETNVFTTVASNGSISDSAVSKGQVYKFTNNGDGTGDVGLRRLTFSLGFNDSGSISGATSGAGGTIDSIYEDSNTNPIGDNAVINADAKSANGIITAVDVIDSGIAYQHGANLTLRHTGNSNIVVSGTANVTTTGVSPGIHASTESHLNTKYIHDNDFYQSHSYQIETGLSLNKYRDILLKSAHVAGTKLFGKVVKESTVNNAVTVSNSSITQAAT